MINYIILILVLFAVPFIEGLSISLIGVSLLLILWKIYFSKNEDIVVKIIFILLCLVLDVTLKYYLGSHLIAIFLTQFLFSLLAQILPDQGSVQSILLNLITIYFYYLILATFLSLNISPYFSPAIIGKIFLSTIITYIAILLFNRVFIFSRDREIK